VDGDDHGTHVSGTIAAATGNGVGIAGIASGARIMTLKFLGPSSGSEADAISAIDYAIAHGAKVINASWGDDTYSGPYQPLQDAIDRAAKSGVLFVAAAGNDATSGLFYPAAYSLVETNVIAVAATDNNDAIAYFSNHGNYPQLAAPGYQTPSTYPPYTAGVFVDKSPYKISYLAFPVESITSAVICNGVVDKAMAALTADKTAPVLVVDDSRADLTHETQGTRLQKYLNALTADGYTNVMTPWVTATQGTPTVATMSGKIVVWFTGSLDSASYDYPNVGTLATTDRTQLGAFLDGGGRLLLSSAKAEWDLTPGYGSTIADQTWLTTYLHVGPWNSYASTTPARADGRWDSAFVGLSPVLQDAKFNASNCDALVSADTYAVRTMDWHGWGYVYMSGTSMAAPHVTGVVALVMQRFPGITAQQVKDRILATVHNVPSLSGKVTTSGRLDASAALAPYAANVTAFTGTLTLDGTITLSWTNPVDAAYDRTVIRGLAGADPTGPADPASRLVYSGTGSTVNDTGLVGGTQMHYMAYTHSTTGLWSDGVPLTVTVISAPPDPVTGLTGSYSAGAVHLSWTNPTLRFSGARVVRSTTAAPTLPTDGTVVGDVTGNAFDDATVVRGAVDTVNHDAVFAHDGTPVYATGAFVDVLVPRDASIPEPPSGIAATPGDRAVTLTWANPTAPDFATLRVLESTSIFATTATMPQAGQTDVTPTNPFIGTTRSRTGLTNGLTYRYTLFAQDTAGNWSVAATISATPNPMVNVYRFYNVRTGTHFYTADPAEMARVRDTMASTYHLEGVAYAVNSANTGNSSPLYRFFNVVTGTHFYTADTAERDRIVATMGGTYHLDGPAYNVCPTNVVGSTTVWRFYNMRTGTHFYTADPAEKASVQTNLGGIYHLDGPAFYLAP